MRKITFFLGIFLLSFFGCDKGCTDSNACNYGLSQDCKYATYEEGLLTGSWNLVDIYDAIGGCVFSFSPDFDCELDQTFDSINFIFNNDKTCEIVTTPSNFSEPVPLGNWSINICEKILNFSYVDSGYELYIYPNNLPFGSQKILQLNADDFFSEDLSGNILHWKKI